jgi:hypothetical protein
VAAATTRNFNQLFGLPSSQDSPSQHEALV